MQLLVIRHAIAEDREDFARTGREDRLRPLTDEGRRKMKRAARGLRSLVPRVDLLATSPLTRTAQTGAILDSVYGGLTVAEIDALSPEATPADFLAWLRPQRAEQIAIVGHEPNLSLLACWLLTGVEQRFFSLRRGGACLLDFRGGSWGTVAAGDALLVWALTPALLRSLED